MASLTPRQSVDVDSFSSSSPNLFSKSEYPFPRLVALQMAKSVVLTVDRPGSSSSNRYQPRRGSTASSIHSIGGTLDTASNWHGLSESGQNGKHVGLRRVYSLIRYSYIYSTTTPHRPDWSYSAHLGAGIERTQATNCPRHPTCDAHQYTYRGSVRIQALFVAGRGSV